ncbi:MAG: hypothetical protein ABEH83_09120 [Halobacterium sp.]
MSLVTAAYGAMSVVLIAAGLTLVYPALKGVQVVVYRRAVLALGTSAVLFVVGWLISDLTYHGLVDARILYVVSSLVITVASVLHLYAIWLFARDFVAFDTDDYGVDVDSGDVEGFENE